MKALIVTPMLALPLMLLASVAFGADPLVVDATAEKQGATWRFDVTLQHPDEGWNHYADGWEIQDADGNRLGYRILHHPHVDEQPFTRSLTGVKIPEGMKEVFIRPHCSTDGWAHKATPLELPQ